MVGLRVCSCISRLADTAFVTFLAIFGLPRLLFSYVAFATFVFRREKREKKKRKKRVVTVGRCAIFT